MTVIAVGSVHGSPGVTSLALDLARLCGGESLLIEADPDGGCLAARLDLAVRPGLTELAGAARVGIAADDLWRFAQPTNIATSVIVAHPAAEQVLAALRAAVTHVGVALRALDEHVIIDVGRLRPGSPAIGLAAMADLTIVLSANSVEAVVSIAHRAQLLRGVTSPLVVLNDSSPYPTADVEEASGQRVWGVVSSDPGRRGARSRSRALDQLLVDCCRDVGDDPACDDPAGDDPAGDDIRGEIEANA